MKSINFIKILFFSIFVLNFLVLNTSSQEYIEASIPSFLSVRAGEKVVLPIEIKNLGKVETRVFLNIFPPYYEGVSTYFDKNEVLIAPNSTAKTNLIISTPIDIIDKIITYQIYLSYNGIEKDYRLNLDIFSEKKEIRVENFGINKVVFNPEEELNLFITYKNTKEGVASVKVRVEVLFEEKNITTHEKFLNILRHSSFNFTYSYKFSYFDKPGKYFFIIYSYDEEKNLISRLVFEIFLNEIKEIKREVIKTGSIISYKVVIYLKNTGNVKQNITLKETIPVFVRPFLIFENLKPKFVEDEAVWELNLEPQEEIKISYLILYWMPISILSILIGAILFFTFFFVLVPQISKKIELTEDIYKVKIILKNNTQKKMKNIEINDFVPLLFSIIKFETLKPQIKKTRDGFNLTWKINELRPKEELIISYNIKPLIEIIGKVKLPKPKVKYTFKK